MGSIDNDIGRDGKMDQKTKKKTTTTTKDKNGPDKDSVPLQKKTKAKKREKDKNGPDRDGEPLQPKTKAKKRKKKTKMDQTKTVCHFSQKQRQKGEGKRQK